MITIEPSVYSCRMTISLGDRSSMSIAKKQEMWDLWKNFRKNIFKVYDNIPRNLYTEHVSMTDDILKSTYPLEDYNLNTITEHWGCSSDVETHDSWVVFNKSSIYYPIQLDFHSMESPPLKWCDYMRKKGFMITLYFLDSNIDRLYEDGQCGKCIYDKGRIVEELYKVPPINYVNARKLYDENKTHNENWGKLREYRADLYELEGFCPHFIILLEEHDGGPLGETCMLIYKMEVLKDLDELEDKLESGEINEGEYVEECNILRKEYDNIYVGSF